MAQAEISQAAAATPSGPMPECKPDKGEAEVEAIRNDSRLDDLVRLWFTLDEETKDIVSAIIQSRSS